MRAVEFVHHFFLPTSPPSVWPRAGSVGQFSLAGPLPLQGATNFSQPPYILAKNIWKLSRKESIRMGYTGPPEDGGPVVAHGGLGGGRRELARSAVKVVI